MSIQLKSGKSWTSGKSGWSLSILDHAPFAYIHFYAYSLTDDHSLHIGWVRSGVVAVVTLSLMVALGTRELRNYKYEFFFVSHVVLSM